jgi:tRNA (cmo5U34)-methyltransferase
MDKLNGFNSVAGVYDFLARLVFGKAMTKSQTHFLPLLSDCSNILILGGGTGWIAEEVAKVSKGDIVFIDASEKMIAKARKRSARLGNRITFIHGTEKDIPQATQFHGVITNFYLDLFSDKDLTRVCTLVTSNVREGGVWLATDFKSEKRWHRMFLEVMYHFFGMTTGLETRMLPEWEKRLESVLDVLGRRTYYGGFIAAVAMKKPIVSRRM